MKQNGTECNLISPVVFAVHHHPRFDFHGFSGSDFTLSNLRAVLSDAGGEAAEKILVKDMPQFQNRQAVLEHMQHYVDLSGCESMEPLVDLLIGRPRLVAKTLSEVAKTGKGLIESMKNSLNNQKRKHISNNVHVARSDDDSTHIRFIPHGCDDEDDLGFSSPVDIESDKIVVEVPWEESSSDSVTLKPAVFAIIVRRVYSYFVGSFEIKLEALMEKASSWEAIGM